MTTFRGSSFNKEARLTVVGCRCTRYDNRESSDKYVSSHVLRDGEDDDLKDLV